MTLSAGNSILAATWLVATGSLAVLSGMRIARRLGDDTIATPVIWVLSTIIQLVAVPLALTAATLVSPAAVLAGHIVASALVWVLTKTSGPADGSANDGPRTDLLGRAVAAAVGVYLAALAAIPTARGLDSFQSEARHYHVSMLALWLNEHTLWRFPFELPGWFTASNPGNAEMIGLWLVLPTHREQVAFLMVLPFALLTVLGTALLVSELGGRAWLGALAAIALLATPIAFGTQAHSLSSDLGALSGFVCGVAFLLRARRESSRRWVIFAGVAIGLAVGSKYTVAAPVAVLLVLAAFTVRPVRRLGWLLPGVVALAGPWLVRNWVLTGNPLFPEQVRLAGWTIFAGGAGPGTYYLTTIAHHLVRGDKAVASRWASVATSFYGPALFTAGLGVVAAAWNKNERRKEMLGVLIVCIAAVLLYLVTPLTGGGPDGLRRIIGSNLRYALPALILGMALAAAALPARIVVLALAGTFVYDAVEISKIGLRADLDFPARWVTVAVLIALLTGVVTFVARRRHLRSPILAIACVGLALAVTSAAIYQRNRNEPISKLDAIVTKIWRPTEAIGVLGVRDFRDLFGARLDRPLVSFSAGGRVDEIPFSTPEGLDRAIALSNVRILVVLRANARDFGGIPALSIPARWSAPPWCDEGGDRLTVVLVRPEPGGACP